MIGPEPTWSGSVADVQAALERKLPADPFLPGPYHLARFEGGLVVYSVVPDRADDGGNLDNNKSEREGATWGSGSGTSPGVGRPLKDA